MTQSPGPLRSHQWRWVLGSFLTVGLLVGCDDSTPVESLPTAVTASPIVTCLGVPAPKCTEFLAEAKAAAPQAPIREIRIVCGRAPCTERSGQVTIDVVDGFGRRTSSGAAWGTATGP
jgi:hypothetical protein